MSELNRWANDVLRGLGIRANRQNTRALIGWAKAEGGHFHNDARFNVLNTTLPLKGAGNTGSQGNIKVYRSWQQGVRATVKTLELRPYGDIRRALRSGSAEDVGRAIVGSPWGTTSAVLSTIGATGPGHASDRSLVGGNLSRQLRTVGGQSATAAFDPGQSLEGVQAAEPTPPPQALVPAGAGLAAPLDARKALALPAGYQGVQGGGGPLPPEPVGAGLSAQGQAVSFSPEQQSKLGGKLRAASPDTGARGTVKLAPGADRPGVATRPAVFHFLEGLAGAYGHELTIGTGSQHNRMTTSGNVSDHWTGHAADVPATGKTLTHLGHLALIHAGMSPAKARKATGGIYNLTWHGRRVQIIFNTTEGGNHWNHLHVGISA